MVPYPPCLWCGDKRRQYQTPDRGTLPKLELDAVRGKHTGLIWVGESDHLCQRTGSIHSTSY